MAEGIGQRRSNPKINAPKKTQRRGGVSRTAVPGLVKLTWTSSPALQRGRAQLSAEILLLLAPRPLERLASTGPRSIERGDKESQQQFAQSGSVLQRGRAQLSAEITRSGDMITILSAASTGPRSIERGDAVKAVTVVAASRSFNGAALN